MQPNEDGERDAATQYNEGWDGPNPDWVYDPSNPAHYRMFGEEVSGTPQITDGDPVAHSPEAMKVLMEQGVDAYHAWLAEHDTGQ